jgi:hypothetical protein
MSPIVMDLSSMFLDSMLGLLKKQPYKAYNSIEDMIYWSIGI